MGGETIEEGRKEFITDSYLIRIGIDRERGGYLH